MMVKCKSRERASPSEIGGSFSKRHGLPGNAEVLRESQAEKSLYRGEECRYAIEKNPYWKIRAKDIFMGHLDVSRSLVIHRNLLFREN